MKALIVVDMQYDFIDGSLAVPGAKDIVYPIQNKMQEYIDEFNVIVLTKCNHPSNHCSFIENGGKWPKHCVHGTRGSYIQFGISAMASTYSRAIFILKGMDSDIEQYSGFDKPELHKFLRLTHTDEVEVCGLARNYCVAATAEAARNLGYKTTILEDLCRSV